jgi:DHA1 family tetracycline resistance protein-like MFS transporter
MMFTLWALYTDHRYGWSPSKVGFSLMFVGVCSGLVQAILVKKIVPALGETKAVTVGMLISTVIYSCYGLATEGWIIYVLMTIGCFAGITGPALQSYITKHVPPNEQGAVQGVFVGLQSLASVPAPFISTYIFGWSVTPGHPAWMAGLAFFTMSLFILTALALARRSFAFHAPTQPTQAA